MRPYVALPAPPARTRSGSGAAACGHDPHVGQAGEAALELADHAVGLFEPRAGGQLDVDDDLGGLGLGEELDAVIEGAEEEENPDKGRDGAEHHDQPVIEAKLSVPLSS